MKKQDAKRPLSPSHAAVVAATVVGFLLLAFLGAESPVTAAEGETPLEIEYPFYPPAPTRAADQ